MHGKDTLIEEVLDWRPYEYMTSRYTMPMPGSPQMLETAAMTELADGRVHLEIRFGPAAPKEKAAFGNLLAMIEPMLRTNCDNLVRLAEEVAASSGVASEPHVARTSPSANPS
jgi:hypothetical protein